MKQYVKKYKERLKTIILISLVALSIGQTAYYWLSSAYSTGTTETNYRFTQFGAKEFNEKKEVYQFSAPPITYLHTPSEIRFLPAKLSFSSDLGPNAYQKMLLQISQTKIENIQSVNPTVEQWKKIIHQPGIEFQYDHPVSLEQVSSFFNLENIKQQTPLSKQQIDRVWITIPNEQSLAQVYIIASRSQNPSVYLASTNLPGGELNKLIQNAKPLTTYTVSARYNTITPNSLLPNGNLYYVPNQPVTVAKLTYPVLEIEIQKMKEALFEDPTLQPLKPREGWEIYAYGTRRTLSYDSIFKEMQYSGQTIETNPNTTSTELTITNAVKKTNNFLHGHFGWTGDFHLDSFTTDKNDMKFRQYDNGLPIYWDNRSGSEESPLPPTIIRMKPYITDNLSVSDASLYHRSLYYWQPTTATDRQTSVSMPDATKLEQTLNKQQINPALIEQIQLVYRANWVDPSKKNRVTLTPYWKIVVSGDGPSFSVNENIYYVGEGGQWIGEKQKQY